VTIIFKVQRLLFATIILSILTADASANRFIRLGEDVEIPVPETWYLATDTLGFPAQLVHESDSAEILLFRSEIVGNDMIGNQDELKKSVDLVVEDVITALHGGVLRTSTGFYDGHRAGFILEFVSTDSVTGIPLEHRLAGTLYRHADSQILFTVWGKAAEPAYVGVKNAIETVQDGLVFRGEYESEVFAQTSMSYWPIVLVVMALIGLLLLRPGRRAKKATPSPPATSDS
jgi:hypothetical protein